MPLSKSPNGGGSEKDGSISTMYCAYCYENGAFKDETITAPEMQEFVAGKMREMGFPKFLAKWFSKGIPKLERWKQ